MYSGCFEVDDDNDDPKWMFWSWWWFKVDVLPEEVYDGSKWKFLQNNFLFYHVVVRGRKLMMIQSGFFWFWFSDIPRGGTRQEGRWPWQIWNRICDYHLRCAKFPLDLSTINQTQKLSQALSVWPGLQYMSLMFFYLMSKITQVLLPDVQNKQEDIANLDHSPELPPCLDVQLKIAEALFLFTFFFKNCSTKAGRWQFEDFTCLIPSSCNFACKHQRKVDIL